MNGYKVVRQAGRVVILTFSLMVFSQLSELRAQDSNEKLRNAHLCPIEDLIDFDATHSLYSADYYEVDCNSQPMANYFYGHPDFPCECIDHRLDCCLPAYGDNANVFPGLSAAVDLDYVHKLPSGRASDYGQVLVDPRIPFIKFQINGQNKFAKVFAILFNTESATEKKSPWPFRLMYVAFETSKTPPEADTREASSCNPIKHDDETNFYAYRAVYKSGKVDIQILILMAKK